MNLLRSHEVNLNGLRMHAFGTAQPALDRPSVVLVHGLGVSSRYMRPAAIRLAAHCNVYAPDLPGFGQSAKPEPYLNLDELAECLAQWARKVVPGPATYLGHSLGAQVVVSLADKEPRLVERAILAGPMFDPQMRALPRLLWRLLIDAAREPFSLSALALRDYLAAGFGRVFHTLKHAFRDPFEEKLGRLSMPALVIRGERDPLSTQEWVEEVTRLLPCGRLTVISGAAHAVNYSTAREVVRLVLSFLGEDRPSSRYGDEVAAGRPACE